MKIEAATLAGGKINQDYYAYGDTYALVLDGSSSFLPEQTSIDAATYVNKLGQAIASKLESVELREIPEAIAESISMTAEELDLEEESSPNSTVAVAKWGQDELAIFVLGDSTCLVLDSAGDIDEITDNRMARFGVTIRDEYKHRLVAGRGFDSVHKGLLASLQRVQRQHRNLQEGYWIASTKPEAAHFALFSIRPIGEVNSIILCSDGGLLIRDELIRKANGHCSSSLEALLLEQHGVENSDGAGVKYPRSKIHDDKTAVLVSL